MRLTIIPVDNTVYVDSIPKNNLDLSGCGVPDNVHALQWFENIGWIEFKQPDPFLPPYPNQSIATLPEWATACYQVWVDAPLPPSE